MILPPETQLQVDKSRLYLNNKHLVKESELNKFYEYVMKYGILPKITSNGNIILLYNLKS